MADEVTPSDVRLQYEEALAKLRAELQAEQESHLKVSRALAYAIEEQSRLRDAAKDLCHHYEERLGQMREEAKHNEGEFMRVRNERDDQHVELMALRKQLPEGMERCTILFKECPVGHGRLTATNWVQHECLHCELATARAERDIARASVKDFYDASVELRKERDQYENEAHAYMAKLANATLTASGMEAQRNEAEVKLGARLKLLARIRDWAETYMDGEDDDLTRIVNEVNALPGIRRSVHDVDPRRDEARPCPCLQWEPEVRGSRSFHVPGCEYAPARAAPTEPACSCGMPNGTHYPTCKKAWPEPEEETVEELIKRAWEIRGNVKLDAFRPARWLITDLIRRLEKLG